MSQPYVGEIRLLPFNFEPSGWAFCNGQLLSISENDTLFSLIGTTYGGDGIATFALPDLRSRAPVHRGTRPGGATHTIGENGGVEQVTLTLPQLPSHNHQTSAASTVGDSQTPARNYVSADAAGRISPYSDTKNTQTVPPTPAGGNQAHNNMPPFLAIHFCISLFGIYPSQN